MRYLIAFFGVVFVSVWGWSGIAGADAPTGQPSVANSSIDRGLAFLAKDAMEWKGTRKCVSCHHAGMVIWSMHEAKERGIAVDEPMLTALTDWVAASADGKIGDGRSESTANATSMKALYFTLALNNDPRPSATTAAGLTLFLTTLVGEQAERGSWSGWPESRLPMQGDIDPLITELVLLALLPAAASGDEASKASRDKGLAWLDAAPPADDLQSVALRLILWQRLGRPAEQWEPLARRIEERQNADGGWSQTPEMASDAFATGQAIWALNQAGRKPDDPAIERGRDFLVKTQREDGSWPMISRPAKPGGAGAKLLTPITSAGSAWGVIGLVRSL